MCSDGIRIAFAEEGVNQRTIPHAEKILQLRNARIIPSKENAFRLRGRLYRQCLPCKILQMVNVTLWIHCDHLTAHHVRTRPLVVIQTSFHGKTAHGAVQLSTLQKVFLLFPVDVMHFDSIPHATESLCRQIHIDPRRHTVFIKIIERRITVTSQLDHRTLVLLRRPMGHTATCKKKTSETDPKDDTHDALTMHANLLCRMINIFIIVANRPQKAQ